MPRFSMLSRRTCLKGLGVALALPLLETMSFAATPPSGSLKQPTRLLFVHWKNGLVANRFWPKDEKSYHPSLPLPPTLEPLRPVLSETLLLGQIKNPCENLGEDKNGAAGHKADSACWLTCAHVNKANGGVDLGISADQFAAEQLGQYTVLPSLELGLAGHTLSGIEEHGYSRAYHTAISYRSATQAVPQESNPRAVLERLFSSRRSAPQKKASAPKTNAGPQTDTGKFAVDPNADAGIGEPSLDQVMVDKVLEHAKSLRKHVSTADQRTLDEYLDGVQSLEKRIAAIERQQAEAARSQNGGKKAGVYSDPIVVTLPKDGAVFSERFRVMADLMILGFQSDVTRVGSISNFGDCAAELGIKEDVHQFTHNDPDKTNPVDPVLLKCLQIELLYLQQVAYVIQRAKDIKDGEGSLLDHSIFMCGSGMGQGRFHNNDDCPTIIAGRGNGTIRTGRYVSQAKGTQGDLLLGILARAGCTVPKQFGLNGTKLSPDLS
jgi:Protein of unknown function (DUF1552)